MKVGRRRERRPERLFFVAAEGERTEYDYLAFLNDEFGAEHRFRIDGPRLSIRRNGLKPAEVVNEAVRAAETGDFDGVWALFDRDQHAGISQAMRRAQEADVEVGFSHPAFELWLLLHFDAVPAGWRCTYPDVVGKLRRLPEFADYGIRGDKSLTHRRARCLLTGQAAAVKRAMALVDQCPAGSCSSVAGHTRRCSPLARCPSTDVWRLLVALGVVEA